MTEPARITRLEIEGFRVIDRLALDLRPMNVLIGENGSGKSTVLEALEILRKAATMTGEQFVSELYALHGGGQMFRSAGTGVGPRLRLAIRVDRGGAGKDYTYELVLEKQNAGWIRVTEERLEIAPQPGHKVGLKVIERVADRAQVFNQQARSLEPVKVADHTVLLSALGAAPGDVLNEALPILRALLGAVRIYPPFETNPAWARRPGEPPSTLRAGVIIRPAHTVERGGANLPNAYQALRNRGNVVWDRVLTTLKLGIGDELEDITIDPDPGGGQVALSLTFRGIGRIPAFALSDGQLSYLTLVAIAELEADVPGLVGMDEPDLHLHPAMIGRVVGLSEAMSLTRTVVITTHSDRLLDALSHPADDVILFEKAAGFRALAFRPDPVQLRYWLETYAGLGSARAEGYGRVIFTRPAAAGGT